MKSDLMSSRLAMGAACASLALFATACGGGGSSASAPPANRTPQFTSAASASVTENSVGAFYTAAASDADGDTLTYAIAGGADASFFQINGTALSFTSSPNFDRFADADQNNVYQVTLRASDGRGASVDQVVEVTVGNDREGVAIRRLATGFDNPVGVTGFLDGQILVGERDGTIWAVDVANGTRRVQFDLNLPAGRELLDVAGFGTGGLVSTPVALVRDSAGIYLVAGLFSSPTREVRIASGDPQGAGATLAYTFNTQLGGQGLLVIAVGDPGGQRAQGTTGYGSVYIVRDPNPQSTLDQFLLVGRGIQQPSRIFDFTQGVLIADAGQTREHELSALVSRDPVNYGWPFFEGSAALMSGGPSPLVAPSFTYPFGTGPLSGRAIRGGLYYDASDPFESSRIASLQDRLVFGDTNGSIFTVGLGFGRTTFENRTRDFVPDAGELGSVVAMAETFDRVLFILDADGELFRVDPA
jgi:hypothetical protein